MEANTGTRLISVLSKLATSHRDEADLEERVQVAQALLSVAGIPVRQATADLLNFCRVHQVHVAVLRISRCQPHRSDGLL